VSEGKLTVEYTSDSDAILWHDGNATFRGFPVNHRDVMVAGLSLNIASMSDATHLLDVPDYASRFLKADMAPYGVELWPAAIMLAEYIAAHDRAPRRALELGSGLGFVSLVAARLGWNVVTTDHEPSAMVFARHNAELNAATNIEFQTLDWNKPPQTTLYARILGADILYQLNNHQPILKCLTELLEPDGVALIADPNRGVADRFSDLASSAGFSVEVIPATAPEAGGETRQGRIFRLTRAD
jgi:predicted nicotinamide N-methyase